MEISVGPNTITDNLQVCACERVYSNCQEMDQRIDEDVWHGNFPRSPVPKTPCSQCGGPAFDPLSGRLIPHAATKNTHVRVSMPQLKIPHAATKNSNAGSN